MGSNFSNSFKLGCLALPVKRVAGIPFFFSYSGKKPVRPGARGKAMALLTSLLSIRWRIPPSNQRAYLVGTPDLLAGANKAGIVALEMISVFILGFSLFALVRFGVSQWRALWVSVATQHVSDSLPLSTGIEDCAIGPRDFGTLKGFCDRLSPEVKRSSSWLREVSIYYRAVAGLNKILRLPCLSAWANREMQLCSRYAAVVLDQNLSMHLDRQLAGRSM
jgi:hypothetical protein